MNLKIELVPGKAIAVRRNGKVAAAIWFGRWVRRPFVYPLLGPGDRELVRLGHPEDPVGHSHHRGVWIGHRDVGGVDFWGEGRNDGEIAVERIRDREENGRRARVVLDCVWRAGDRVLLREERRVLFEDLDGGELGLEIQITLRAAGPDVSLGRSNFGLLGIRVARTMRVAEKLGGLIFNSEEAENEAGCFGQHAAWCDYSGPVPLPGPAPGGTSLPAVIAGIACFNHPQNPGGEVLWHVRDDGWMGPSLTRQAPLTVREDPPLRVRYRLETHAGRPWQAGIGERYRRWAGKS